jgi:H+/gluconate symporter-like permease
VNDLLGYVIGGVIGIPVCFAMGYFAAKITAQRERRRVGRAFRLL